MVVLLVRPGGMAWEPAPMAECFCACASQKLKSGSLVWTSSEAPVLRLSREFQNAVDRTQWCVCRLPPAILGLGLLLCQESVVATTGQQVRLALEDASPVMSGCWVRGAQRRGPTQWVSLHASRASRAVERVLDGADEAGSCVRAGRGCELCQLDEARMPRMLRALLVGTRVARAPLVGSRVAFRLLGGRRCVAFTGDSEHVVGAGLAKAEHIMYIWNRLNGKLECILEGPKDGVTDIAWHPLRSTLISVTSAGQVGGGHICCMAIHLSTWIDAAGLPYAWMDLFTMQEKVWTLPMAWACCDA
jgi:hypothetical protein